MDADEARPSPYFTEEHHAFRSQIRRFVEREVVPHADAWEETGYIPRDLLKRIGALGYYGIRHPQEHGGLGMDTMTSVVFAEELARSGFGGFAGTVITHSNLASPYITQAGTPEQIARYEPAILSGEKIVAIAVSEPGAGSDVAGMVTRAVRDGNGWRVNGSKMFITNGIHGDLYILAARTNPDEKGAKGISLFIVEKGTPGLNVSNPIKKTGWLSSDMAALSFDDMKLPGDALLGEENRGFYAVMRNFAHERLLLGAMCNAQIGKALEITAQYLKDRKAFGKPLSEQPAIRQQLGTIAGKLEAAKQLVYHTAWLDGQGHDVKTHAAMIKSLCGELVNEAMYKCVQFHGGAGYLRESPIERMSRDARVMAIGGGATEVMLELVARQLLD